MNAGSIDALIDRLESLNDARGGALEAVFVVDGSPDTSLAALRTKLARSTLDAQLLALSRNFGSFSAIRAGLAVARGDFIGVMAADLQEPPEVVSDFFDSMEAGECDIAIGQRTGRNDSALSSAASRLYWEAYRRLINRDIPSGGVDVFGCTREVATHIIRFSETHTSLVGILYWVGYRRQYVPYVRQAREHGSSAWTTTRKVRYLFDSVYAFTDLPVMLLQVVGFFGVIGSVLLGSIIFVVWLMGGITQPGYTPIMIVILGSTSVLLLGLGVVGSYVARGYENSKGRPISIVASHEQFGPRE
jgi:glycosyltransferase involved in cell wall biosynthesis